MIMERIKEIYIKMKKIILTLCLVSAAFASFSQSACCDNPKSTVEIKFEFTQIQGIGFEEGVTRRDPSDIIKVNGVYYIWYTKIPSRINGVQTPLYPSGYYGTIWYAVSEDEGINWKEAGQALGTGSKGSFDSHAVFTPNILADNGKYYLYYTGVKPTPGNPDGSFENNSMNDFTAIGVAVAQSPDGPFKRINRKPVITISEMNTAFDSYRVDDAALVVREGKYLLYYKGRSQKHGKSGPWHTEMGVAVAEHPEGPFVKHIGSVLMNSHEVLVWNTNGGIASLASFSHSIHWAQDGLYFFPVHEKLSDIPAAPGLYRPHLENGHVEDKIPGWGISHASRDGSFYLIKFKMIELISEIDCK